MNETELIQKIRQATDECWKKLELRHEGIISIPDEIGQLQRLEELHLIGNALVKVPSAIGEAGGTSGALPGAELA
jgi:Leucine-rich repeat (LRR) protein